MSNFESKQRRSNPRGQLNREYKARVIDIKEPNGLHLAKVRIVGLWDDIPIEDLPWAEYKLAIGARVHEGDVMPCKEGDLVWVDFPQLGDSRYPRITGGAYEVTGDKQLPLDAFSPTYEHKRLDTEPPPIQAQYGDKVLDLFGVLQQITMNGEWCITHKKSGTGIEINKNGDFVTHVESNKYDSVAGNLNIIVKGESNITSEGHVNIVAPTANFGTESPEPMVMGKKLTDFLNEFVKAFLEHSHIGNMGAPVKVTDTKVELGDILSSTMKVQE